MNLNSFYLKYFFPSLTGTKSQFVKEVGGNFPCHKSNMQFQLVANPCVFCYGDNDTKGCIV